jgi:hypothetical protein
VSLRENSLDGEPVPRNDLAARLDQPLMRDDLPSERDRRHMGPVINRTGATRQ